MSEPRASISEESPTEHTEAEWTAEMQVALFQAMSRCRPVGVHKHFRMLYVQRYLNNHMGTRLSTDEIWAFLNTLFDFDALDVLAEEEEEGSVTRTSPLPGFVSALDSGDPFKYPIEFMLPMKDFESVIEKKRKSDTSHHASQKLQATRSRNGSISSSARSTPDPSHVVDQQKPPDEEDNEHEVSEDTAPKSTRKKGPGRKKKDDVEFSSPAPMLASRRTRSSIAPTATPTSVKKKKK